MGEYERQMEIGLEIVERRAWLFKMVADDDTLHTIVHICHAMEWEVANVEVQAVDQAKIDRVKARRDASYCDLIEYCRQAV
jgi:hypothetical protein